MSKYSDLLQVTPTPVGGQFAGFYDAGGNFDPVRVPTSAQIDLAFDTFWPTDADKQMDAVLSRYATWLKMQVSGRRVYGRTEVGTALSLGQYVYIMLRTANTHILANEKALLDNDGTQMFGTNAASAMWKTFKERLENLADIVPITPEYAAFVNGLIGIKRINCFERKTPVITTAKSVLFATVALDGSITGAFADIATNSFNNSFNNVVSSVNHLPAISQINADFKTAVKFNAKEFAMKDLDVDATEDWYCAIHNMPGGTLTSYSPDDDDYGFSTLQPRYQQGISDEPQPVMYLKPKHGDMELAALSIMALATARSGGGWYANFLVASQSFSIYVGGIQMTINADCTVNTQTQTAEWTAIQTLAYMGLIPMIAVANAVSEQPNELIYASERPDLSISTPMILVQSELDTVLNTLRGELLYPTKKLERPSRGNKK